MKKKAIIYGAGQTGKRCYEDYKEEYDIIYFVDNDIRKQGMSIFGKMIKPVKEIDTSVDTIIIGTVYDKENIVEQLVSMGIASDKIRFHRRNPDRLTAFLNDFAKIMENQDGSCAEVGVYRGESACKINKVFSNRSLYLFDTFTGFDIRDLEIERGIIGSDAQEGAFADTSESIVMEKMEYPEKIIIKKGYFPETADGIEEQFLLVRLDIDLYMPTLSGLRKFAPLMVKNGLIIVHDYFSESYNGVAGAVNEFCNEYPKEITKVPLGDGFSIILTGF